MKRLILLILILMFIGCKPKERIVNNYITKTEYQDKYRTDTLIQQKYDSVFVYQKGDTFYTFKYKIQYRDKYRTIRDSILKTDTVLLRIKETVTVKQKTSHGWKIFFAGMLLPVLAFGIFKVRKKMKLLGYI